FERYVADTDPAFLEGVQKPTAALISQLHADRLSIVNLLSSFSEEALLRKGIHPRYGKFVISQWVEFFLLHEAHHVFMIFMLTSDLKR
ncbi:MAG TPA: DinB family protein, partial [Chitinophagaceae bacterium]